MAASGKGPCAQLNSIYAWARLFFLFGDYLILAYRILNINHKKELPWSLWVLWPPSDLYLGTYFGAKVYANSFGHMELRVQCFGLFFCAVVLVFGGGRGVGF